MAEPISIQQLKDASEDAISLAEFINKPENVMIPRRLSSDIHSLQYYLEYMKSFAQRSYETYDEMVANASNLSDNVSVFVTNDLDSSKNGIYTYNGTEFVKGEYQPENAAKDFVESKLGGLEVFDGKVRTQDVSTSDGSTQEVKNTEFRRDLDALPFEEGVLSDTFVTMTSVSGTSPRNLRDFRVDFFTPKDFGAADNTLMSLLDTTRSLPIGAVVITDDTGRVKVTASSGLKTVGDSYVEKISSDTILVTVGDTGDFATINDALLYLDGMKRGYQKSASATIKLLSGFVMKEQVEVVRADLGWVVITSEDATVTVDRASITYAPTGEPFKPIFFGINNAVLPTLATKFVYNATGIASSQSGVWIEAGSQIVIASGAGVTDCHGRGLHISNNSIGYARNTYFDNCGIGVRVSNGSMCQFRNSFARNCEFGTSCEGSVLSFTNADFSDANQTCITTTGCELFFKYGKASRSKTAYGLITYGGTAFAEEADLSDNFLGGLRAEDGAVVNFKTGKADNCGEFGVRALNGSIVAAQDASASNCDYGVRAGSGSTVSARDFKANNSSVAAFYATRASTIDATDAVSSGSGTDCFVTRGGIIAAHGAERSSTVALNSLTSDGIVFTDPQYSNTTVNHTFPALATGEQQSLDVVLSRANMGDKVLVSFDKNLRGTRLWGEVTTKGVVTVYQSNGTGAEVSNINEGMLKVSLA